MAASAGGKRFETSRVEEFDKSPSGAADQLSTLRTIASQYESKCPNPQINQRLRENVEKLRNFVSVSSFASSKDNGNGQGKRKTHVFVNDGNDQRRFMVVANAHNKTDFPDLCFDPWLCYVKYEAVKGLNNDSPNRVYMLTAVNDGRPRYAAFVLNDECVLTECRKAGFSQSRSKARDTLKKILENRYGKDILQKLPDTSDFFQGMPQVLNFMWQTREAKDMARDRIEEALNASDSALKGKVFALKAILEGDVPMAEEVAAPPSVTVQRPMAEPKNQTKTRLRADRAVRTEAQDASTDVAQPQRKKARRASRPDPLTDFSPETPEGPLLEFRLEAVFGPPAVLQRSQSGTSTCSFTSLNLVMDEDWEEKTAEWVMMEVQRFSPPAAKETVATEEDVPVPEVEWDYQKHLGLLQPFKQEDDPLSQSIF